ADRRVEAQGIGPGRLEPGGGLAVGAGEQGDIMTERYQLVAEIGDDPLGAAIEQRRHRLAEGSDLGDPHDPAVPDDGGPVFRGGVRDDGRWAWGNGRALRRVGLWRHMPPVGLSDSWLPAPHSER